MLNLLRAIVFKILEFFTDSFVTISQEFGTQDVRTTQDRESTVDRDDMFYRGFGKLEELIMLECDKLNHISEKEIAGPNIKILVIRHSPLTNFSFKDQGVMDVGIPVLRGFTLKETSIHKIFIPDGVYSSLKIIDLSRNFWSN